MRRFYQEPTGDRLRFLCLALRGQRSPPEDAELLALFHQLGPAACLALAQANHVEAMVGVAMEGVLPSGGFPQEWRRSLAANQARVVALVNALESVVRRLEAAGIRSAVVEGGGAWLGSELPLSAFGAGDFDLLVAAGHDAVVAACFRAEGFVAETRREVDFSRVEFRRQHHGATQWLNAGAIPFDRRWVPLHFTDRSAQWLARRIPSRKSAALHVLDPTDGLLFVCIHTSLHSYVRAPGIRLHVEADRLVRDNPIDWERLVQETRATGLVTRVFVSLALAAAFFATPIPEAVFAGLCPPGWRWWAIRSLLQREGILAQGRAKLPRGKTVLLDALLEDRGVGAWTRSALLPSGDWLRARHSDPAAAPLWRLHLNRFRRLLMRWRPQ